MKVTSLHIRDFKRFRTPGIKEFYAQFNAPVQIITGVNGSAKGLRNDELVRVPGGWKKMGDLQMHDAVMSADGTASPITKIIPLGRKPVFVCEFEDGRSVQVTEDHLWSVIYSEDDDFSTKPTASTPSVESTEFLFKFSKWKPEQLKNFYIPLPLPEQIPDKEVIIHPFVIGAMLTYGAFMNGMLTFCGKKEMLEKINILVPELFTNITELESGYCAAMADNEIKLVNGLTFIETVKKLSPDAPFTSIPKTYMNLSPSQRMDLLCGIIGSNTALHRSGHWSLTQKISNLDLAYQIRDLVRSLGGKCIVEKDIRPYVLKIDLWYMPKSVQRDLVNRKKVTCSGLLAFKSIRETTIVEECTCIAIAHASKQYVTKDYIVTHNSSVLRELCPLPPVRTIYETNGFKEVKYVHNSHEYVLTNDFSSKTSPHSFQVDGKELNISGTTEVQEELVAQHFGITPAIRNLIYNKVMLCSTTKSERKNLFLNINPMQLGLILATHKKALSCVKDCKANLNHLHARRIDIEGRLLSKEILEKHTATKQKLTEQVSQLEALITKLDQHVTTLNNSYANDLEYYRSCQERGTSIFPVKQALEDAKQILSRVWQYTDIDRDRAEQQFQNLKEEKQQKSFLHKELVKNIINISQEINEYNAHFENATERPAVKIETEIKELDKELAKYTDLPTNPISWESLPAKNNMLADPIKDLLFLFRDMPVKLIPEKEYQEKKQRYISLQSELNLLTQQLTTINETLERYTKELFQNKQNAGVPDECSFNNCGLKQLFDKQTTGLNENIKRFTEQKEKYSKLFAEKEKEYKTLYESIKYYLESDIYDQYYHLKNILSLHYPIDDWDSVLLQKLNTQPLLILNQLQTYVDGSNAFYTWQKLFNKKQLLTKELETLMSTTGASKDFLKNKLKEKEAALQKAMSQSNQLEAELKAVEAEYLLSLMYHTDCGKIKQYIDLMDRGIRALIIENSVKYWNKLKDYLTKAKWELSEELRKLESIVREQVLLRNTYENEIMNHIKKYTQEKSLYEKLELALSPTTGLPHKSMVRYLNALINNVNYFINQVWSYKLKILSLSENQPIDYAFRIEVANAVSGDINELSDGQTEIVNLSWVLAILLQMKLLDKIPFFADETGRALDANHRNALLKFLGSLIDNKLIEQLFIVNHYAVFTDGFRESDVICLSRDQMSDLPGNTNEYVKIV